MFYGFHKPPNLLTEEGGGLGISSSLAWDMPKKTEGFFFGWDRKLNGKLVGGMRNWVSD